MLLHNLSLAHFYKKLPSASEVFAVQFQCLEFFISLGPARKIKIGVDIFKTDLLYIIKMFKVTN